jgi:hypothetical protein
MKKIILLFLTLSIAFSAAALPATKPACKFTIKFDKSIMGNSGNDNAPYTFVYKGYRMSKAQFWKHIALRFTVPIDKSSYYYSMNPVQIIDDNTSLVDKRVKDNMKKHRITVCSTSGLTSFGRMTAYTCSFDGYQTFRTVFVTEKFQ